MASDALKGVLQFTYSVTKEGDGYAAEATLFFRTLSAEKVEPGTLGPTLSKDDVGNLQELVTNAIDCPGA